jgi:hypothetical protein
MADSGGADPRRHQFPGPWSDRCGIAVAVVDYGLCPTLTIDEITAQLRKRTGLVVACG